MHSGRGESDVKQWICGFTENNVNVHLVAHYYCVGFVISMSVMHSWLNLCIVYVCTHKLALLDCCCVLGFVWHELGTRAGLLHGCHLRGNLERYASTNKQALFSVLVKKSQEKSSFFLFHFVFRQSRMSFVKITNIVWKLQRMLRVRFFSASETQFLCVFFWCRSSDR